MGKFNLLWQSPKNAVIAPSKEVRKFVLDNTNHLGETGIVVLGNYRLIRWKNIGLGLCRVWTVNYCTKE